MVGWPVAVEPVERRHGGESTLEEAVCIVTAESKEKAQEGARFPTLPSREVTCPQVPGTLLPSARPPPPE